MAIPALTTRRLILRPLELADAEAIQALFPHWEIVKFLSAQIPWPYPEDGAITFLRDVALPAMRDGTEWHWSIRRKQQPTDLIGVISLMDKPDDNRGFWLSPEWQGQGLMAEASAAVTDFWFDVLSREVLRVPKAVQNSASRRISMRTGMRVVWTGERDYVCGRAPAELWEITADEWRRQKVGVRPASRKDADWLADMFARSMREAVALARGSWDSKREDAQFRAQLEIADTWVIQLEDDDVGFLSLRTLDGNRLELHTLCVEPDRQGAGVGACIMGDVMAAARAAGSVIELSVLKSNSRAERFFARLGFGEISRSTFDIRMRWPFAGQR
jgi:RimJ/RimL family protein N-acetyltransferase